MNDIEALAKELYKAYASGIYYFSYIEKKTINPEFVKRFDVMAKHVQKLILEARMDEQKEWGMEPCLTTRLNILTQELSLLERKNE